MARGITAPHRGLLKAPAYNPDVCPECRSGQTGVIDSRMVKDRRRRRHECHDCKARWSSVVIALEHYEAIQAKADELKEIKRMLREVLDREEHETALLDTGKVDPDIEE